MRSKTGSPRFQMDQTDWMKIGKGALIAGIAAILTYLAQAFGLAEETVTTATAESEEAVNGIPPVVLMWGLSIVVNLARKWIFKQGK